jgi:hypothetical protein
MIRHVVLFTWAEGMTREKEAQFTAELTALAATLPVVRSYHAGADAGLIEGNFDYAVVADFDDADSYIAYRDDPRHQAIIAQYSRPNTKARASVQYEI